MPINVLALIYGGSMLINVAWFRPATNPTIGAAFGIANWPLLGGAPIFELLIAVLLIVGSIYWFAVQRDRVEDQHPTAAPGAGSGVGMRPAR